MKKNKEKVGFYRLRHPLKAVCMQRKYSPSSTPKPRQFSVCRIKQEIIFNWVTKQVKRTQCQKLVLAYSLVLNKRPVLNVRFIRKTTNLSSHLTAHWKKGVLLSRGKGKVRNWRIKYKNAGFHHHVLKAVRMLRKYSSS